MHFYETQSFELHFVITTVRQLLFHNNHFRKTIFTWRINLDWGVLLGFFKIVYRPFFLHQSGSFLNPSWSCLNQDLCCVHC